MATEYSLNETIQSQIGEFQYLYVNGVNLDTRISALEGNVTFDSSNLEQDIVLLTDRVSALEGSSNNSSDVDNLTQQLEALQTRTGTLESLITLFTNNNSNDTHIEHRLSTLEQKLTALKAIYEAKRAVYNMPLDW